jgi:flagellar basal-body rod modification protein FlgD
MRADLQQAYKPPEPIAAPRPVGVGDDPTKEVPGGQGKVDFLSVLGNSNQQLQKDRDAKANGTGLSGAESYEDFLKKMNEKTEKQRIPKNTLDKDDFMNLFVKQLQHQDPLNPEDSTEMASRLAQFNSLEQMLNVNTTLEKMLSAQESSRNAGFISYLGKEVMIDDGRLRITEGKVADATFELDATVNTVNLEVRDESGTLVGKSQLGSMNKGIHNLVWDAKSLKGQPLANGVYSFALTTPSGTGGADVPVKVKSKAQITGVDLKNPKGELFTNLGRVTFDKVGRIGEQNFTLQDLAKPGPKVEDQKPVDKNIDTTGMSEPKVEPTAPVTQSQVVTAKASTVGPEKTLKQPSIDSPAPENFATP